MESLFHNIIRVFSYPNYRYYFCGQTLSLIGSWMHSTAMSWLVWRLTSSPSIVGFVGFFNMLPSLFLSYFGGVIADKINLKKGLHFTQMIAFLLSFLIAILTLSGNIKIWHIFIIGFLIGVVGSFDMPFRQSFIIQIVDKKILHNAIAMNSVMFNISRIIGPAIAGFVIKYSSEGYCFLINSISYLAIIFALIKINPAPRVLKTDIDFRKSFKEGIFYINKTLYIKYPILHMFMLSFVVMPIITLMPVYVSKLGGDSTTLGIFMSSIGIGAIIGGLSLASKDYAKNYSSMVNLFSTLYGISVFFLSLSNSLYISIFFLLLAGIGTSRQVVGLNTIIQTLVKEELRGRVISMYSLSFMALAPFGNLFWGQITHIYGIKITLMLASAWVIFSNFIFYKNMKNIKRNILLYKTQERITNFDII